MTYYQVEIQKENGETEIKTFETLIQAISYVGANSNTGEMKGAEMHDNRIEYTEITDDLEKINYTIGKVEE